MVDVPYPGDLCRRRSAEKKAAEGDWARGTCATRRLIGHGSQCTGPVDRDP